MRPGYARSQGGGVAVPGRADEWMARRILTETNVTAPCYRSGWVPTERAEGRSHDQTPSSNRKPRKKTRSLLGLTVTFCLKKYICCPASQMAVPHLELGDGQSDRIVPL